MMCRLLSVLFVGARRNLIRTKSRSDCELSTHASPIDVLRATDSSSESRQIEMLFPLSSRAIVFGTGKIFVFRSVAYG